MPRTPLWKSIQTALTQDLAQGRYNIGDKLPTEAALADRFSVNRHTVRQALAAMADDGLVHARRGSGVFVTTAPTDYPIGKRVRFHQNLTRAGRTPAKQVLAVETRPADAREAAALGLNTGELIHCYDGLSLADNAPVALFRSSFPAARFDKLPAHIAEHASVTRALAACGIADYTRASTRLTAKSATATQAHHLRIPEQAPVLRAVSINIDAAGTPIEYGRTWFAGDRVTLTLSENDPP